MARPKKPHNQKLVQIPANVSPQTVKTLRKLAANRDWSVAQTVRKMLELGLKVELSSIQAEAPKDHVSI